MRTILSNINITYLSSIIMEIIGLPEKEISKKLRELLELHKKVLTNYLRQRDIKLKIRNKFFGLYDHYIDEENIEEYFFAPVKLFVLMLVRNELSKIRNFKSAEINSRKTRKLQRKIKREKKLNNKKKRR